MSQALSSIVATANAVRLGVRHEQREHLGRFLMSGNNCVSMIRSKNYSVVFALLETGIVTITAFESIAFEAAWHAETPLSECGVSSYKKLSKCIKRGSLYMKDGIAYYAFVDKNNSPVAAVALQSCDPDIIYKLGMIIFSF